MKRKSRLLSFILLVLSLILLAGCAKNTAKPSTDAGRATTIKVEEPEEADVAEDVEEPEEADAAEDVEEPQEADVAEDVAEPENKIAEDGYYYDLESVVLYLDEYGRLPGNYITKKEAEKLGWEGGPVSDYYDGGAIGGSHFGNYEKLLPDGDYKECDIDTNGTKGRGAKRLVFSSDGKYYYTDDHYESFHEVVIKDGTVEVLK